MPYKSKTQEALYQKNRNRIYKSNHVIQTCGECGDTIETHGQKPYAKCKCGAIWFEGVFLHLRKWENEQS